MRRRTQHSKGANRRIDDSFLRGEPSKPLLATNALMAIIYFAVMAFGFTPSNPYLFGLLIAGGAFNLVQILGYCYTIWSPQFKERSLKNFDAPVDVFITVCGEPVRVVERTLRAALAMRYPNFTVYILNDGYVTKKDNWHDIIRLARRYGVQCMTRRRPGGAKAGNINYGLKRTKGSYVAMFDADHAPRPDFLRQTMGYFVDTKMGFVQTPQFYANKHANTVAQTAWCQQTLFFGPIMRGKNRQNAAFMCGTNMVVRRAALLQAGGMCEANIAEDFLTSLFIHAKGWKSVYVPKILAKGMAPEDFLSYYKQQYRWARGSLEVIFKHNPFFMRGLTLGQKLHYVLSASYYLSGVVVLIHAALPLLFLFTGQSAMQVSTMNLALVFIPYIFLTLYTLQRTSQFSYTFGAISFSLSAFYIHVRAIVAAITGQKTGFAVTSKSKVHGSFLRLALPHMVYVTLVAIGVAVGLLREGFTASLITNISWAIVNIVVFIPFILAAGPSRGHYTQLIKTTITALRKVSRAQYLAAGGVVACMAVAALVAVYFSFPQSLRVGEAQNMWQASHSLLEVLNGSAQNMQMPLYLVILHVWQFYFGNEVSVVRLLSLLIFLATIPLFYIAARQLLRRSWALLATALIGLSPFMHWLASDARAYALLGLLAVFSHVLFIRMLTKNKGWLGYGMCAVLGLYTHYFFAAALLIHVAMAVFSGRSTLPAVRTKIIGVASFALAAWLPWLFVINARAVEVVVPLAPTTPSSVDMFGVFSQFSLGFQSSLIQAMVIACWPLLILVGFFAVQRRLRIRPIMLYIAAAGLAPVVLAYAVSFFTTPFFASHYMVVVVAPLTISAVWLVSHYRGVYAVAACGLAVSASVVALYYQARSPENPARQDYKAAAVEIGSKATPRDIVVLTAPDAMYPFGYYYHGRAQLTTLPRLDSVVPTSRSVYSSAPLPLQVDMINRGHQHIFVLVSNYQGHQKQVVEYYDTHSKKIAEQRFPSSLTLFVYKN